MPNLFYVLFSQAPHCVRTSGCIWVSASHPDQWTANFSRSSERTSTSVLYLVSPLLGFTSYLYIQYSCIYLAFVYLILSTAVSSWCYHVACPNSKCIVSRCNSVHFNEIVLNWMKILIYKGMSLLLVGNILFLHQSHCSCHVNTVVLISIWAGRIVLITFLCQCIFVWSYFFYEILNVGIWEIRIF